MLARLSLTQDFGASMSLADIVQMPLQRLKLSARDHARLLEGALEEMERASKASRDTCCECGISIPGYMEYHHPKGHTKNPKKGDLQTICQFCHNLKHPLWAGERKRIVPVFAPDYSQVDLNRLAWVCLSWRDEIPEAVDTVVDLMGERQTLLEGVTGPVAVSALIEAAFAIKDNKALSGVSLDAFARIDASLRFWPAELTDDFDGLAPAARLSRWDNEGFHCVADEVGHVLRDHAETTPDQVIEKLQLNIGKVAPQETPDEDLGVGFDADDEDLDTLSREFDLLREDDH